MAQAALTCALGYVVAIPSLHRTLKRRRTVCLQAGGAGLAPDDDPQKELWSSCPSPPQPGAAGSRSSGMWDVLTARPCGEVR